LQPRAKFAAEIGVSDSTAKRMNLPATIIGGCSYIMRRAALQLLADRAKRRNEPPARRSRIASRR
jgi:hypothetical protein